MKFCIAIGEKTSPTTALNLDGDFVQSMERAKKLGYDGVEIHTADPDDLDPQILLPACERLNLFIATIGTGLLYWNYGLSLVDEDSEKRQRLLCIMKKFIDKASILGSKVTIGSAKGNIPKGENREPYLKLMGENLKILDEYAAEKDVFLLLEATNRFENNVINTGRDICQMIEKNQLKHTQALMDSFHINIEERDIRTCLKDTGKYLGHIHFGDNTRMYPGSGEFNFPKFVKAIDEYGYDGVLSLECFPMPDQITAAREAMKFFEKYFPKTEE
mgnify:CR=1 FL=1